MAQLVEHHLAKVRVAGSSPSSARAIGAVVAHFLDTEGVTGSNQYRPLDTAALVAAFLLSPGAATG